MIGVAAAVISAGAFFSDLEPSVAQAAAFQLPARKVKTVAIVDDHAEKGPSVTQADRSRTASVKPAVRERSALHRANPRWARDGSNGSGSASQKEALLAAYADDESNPVNVALGSATDTGTGTDPFAMIVTPGESTEPTVELAGTVPHVPAPAPRASAARESDDDDRPAPKAATTGRALTDTTTVNEAANMRAAGRSGSAVIMVVPDGARVSIAPGCEQWCEISYNGRRGFVYKDFIGSGRVAAKPRANVETVSAQPLDKAIYGDTNFINSGSSSSRASGTTEKTASETARQDPKKAMAEPSNR